MRFSGGMESSMMVSDCAAAILLWVALGLNVLMGAVTHHIGGVAQMVRATDS